MTFSGKFIEPVISIKRPEKGDSQINNKAVKCPECRRLTMKNNKCERCGHVNRKHRMIIL